jgi:NADH-quinone oxidoreductase subunit F
MSNSKIEVLVGVGSCGIAAGASLVYDEFKKEEKNGGFILKPTGCIGMCYKEVLVDVYENGNRTVYGNVKKEDVGEIIKSHIKNGIPVERLIIRQSNKEALEEKFIKKQKRIVLRNAGRIDPGNIDEYIANNGYEGLRKALKIGRTQIIEEMKKSGLRGRGGAGFPTWMKWKFAFDAQGDEKYMVCNADEGDPGAFMDRSVLEGDPHSVLEGLAIGAYAIGASNGVIYVRAEYPLAIKNLKKAILDANSKGFLGENILNSNFSFQVEIKEGAGAFVCGEETALIASVEGMRGMPRLRPPFPANSGIFKKPTNINNVETLANIPWIILNGGEQFSSIGTKNSKGTKVFALTGKVKKGGLAEVPMGMSIRDIVFDIGGGTSSGKPVKAVQLGGPSGGCIPESMLDTPVDYESLNATGAIMGSGGMVVMDTSSCMVDIARFFLNFTQEESCGKCTFCRIGTKRMLEILTRICDGKGEEGDIEKLEKLAVKIKKSALCGLGQTAPNPVLTTIKYFRDEYEAHIRDKKCPSGVCKPLIHYEITDKCVGCTACAKACPANAISGEVKGKHKINQNACIKCGQCIKTCKFDAIIVE